MTIFERHTLAPTLLFNLEDGFARDRLGPHAHPRPQEPLRFWLVARIAPGPREDYGSGRELVVTRNPSGYHLYFGEEWLTADIRQGGASVRRPRRRTTLAPGRYLIRVTSPVYQDEERTLTVPIPNLNGRDPGNPDPSLRDPVAQYTFVLRPSYAYPFPDLYPIRIDDPFDCPDPPLGRRGPTILSGTLHAHDGAGVPGATVEVVGLSASYRTAADGEWVLPFPDQPRVGPDPLPQGGMTVRFTLPNRPPIDVPDVCVLRGCSTSLAQTGLRGWVQRRGLGVAGARVLVGGRPAAVDTRSGGDWTYYDDLNQPAADEIVSVTATLPDGASQTINGIPIRRRATTMVPTFTFP